MHNYSTFETFLRLRLLVMDTVIVAVALSVVRNLPEVTAGLGPGQAEDLEARGGKDTTAPGSLV